MKNRGFWRIIGAALVAAFILAVVLFFNYYQKIFKANVPDQLKDEFVYIPTGSTFEEVVDILVNGGFIIDKKSFVWTAEQMKYIKNPMRPGRFKITPGWNNRQLVGHLRGGKQAPVNMVLSPNARLPEEVAGNAAKYIEADSISITVLLKNPGFLSKHNYTPETVMSLFIPNTYEFFWNTDAEGFLNRMLKEHDTFWSKNNRIEKAKALNLSEKEVYTMASIVERETNFNEEKPRMAGVYLNRIKMGMKLEADPTVVFANRDFTINRVLYKHLEFDSPYNTYKYMGLPPGPISIASISSIDAVLNAEKHDYIFFVAKGDGTGSHSFAKTLSGHNRNVDQFKKNLKIRGLR